MKHKIVFKKTDELIPYINNSRTHSDEQVLQICASIQEFGFNNPILIDGDNGLIAGHGRLMAAKKLLLDTVPCIELSHLSPAQKKAYIIADNQISLNSGWDLEKLSLEIEAIGELDFDLSLLGFADDFLAELFDEPSQENDQPPNSEELNEIFNLLITCDNENHQKALYEELTEKGLKCRVQSL